MRHHGSHGQVGDTLFSEDHRACSSCGWGTFWARQGNFDRAVCERCGAPVPPVVTFETARGEKY